MTQLRLSLQAYPLALPHIAANEGTPSAFFAACDGTRTFDEVIEFDPKFEAIAANLDDVVWLAEPLAPARERDPAAERVLVLSTHPEDAYISMGGWLLAHRDDAETTVASCFSRVVGTTRSDAFVSVKEISAIRRDEAAISARLAGTSNVFLQFPAVEVRMAEMAERYGHDSEATLRRTLKMMLWQLIEERQPSRIFAPAAIGGSVDQKLILEAVLELFEDAWFPDARWHLYEDFPYCASYIAVDDFLASFENAYVDVQPWYEDITSVVAEKSSLLGVYRSRLLRPHEEISRRVAERNLLLHRQRDSGTRAVERFWTLGLAPVLYRP